MGAGQRRLPVPGNGAGERGLTMKMIQVYTAVLITILLLALTGGLFPAVLG